MPKDLRVAEVAQAARVGDHRVVGILRPGAAAVGAVGHALRLDLGLLGLLGVRVVIGKEGDEGRVVLRAEARGVVPIDDGATGEDVSEAVGRQGDREVLPVHEVAADGVAPVHGPPDGFLGVVLIEEVVLPVVIHHAVGVVHPVFGGREVDLRAVHFVEGQGVGRGSIGVGRCVLVARAGGEAEQSAQRIAGDGFHVSNL